MPSSTKTAKSKPQDPLASLRNEPISSFKLTLDEPAASDGDLAYGSWQMDVMAYDGENDQVLSLITLSGFVIEPEQISELADMSYFYLYDSESQESYDVGEALLLLGQDRMRADTYRARTGRPAPKEEWERRMDLAVYRHVHLESITILPGFASPTELDLTFCRLIKHLAEDGELFSVNPDAFFRDVSGAAAIRKRKQNVNGLMTGLGFVFHRGYWILTSNQDAAVARHTRRRGDIAWIDLSERGTF